MKQLILELLKRKRTLFIAMGLLLLLNVVFFVAVDLFQAATLERKQAAWMEQRKRLDALAHGSAGATYRKAKGDLEKIWSMIPEKRRFPTILGHTMQSASLCGVATESITYKPNQLKDKRLLAYEITMTVQGRYEAVRCFLHELQTMQQLVVVEGVKLSNEDPYAEKVSMDLRLTAYLRTKA